MRVNSSLFRILLTLLLAGVAFAQETPPVEESGALPSVEEPDAPPPVEADDAAGTEDGEQEADGAAEDEEDLYDFDISDLDDQTYDEDDDGFVPTEEIPADEPIPFPTDI